MSTKNDDTVTAVSYNRPLTRGAAKDLKEYGVVSEESVNEYGRWTVVELEREPPKTVLEKHELRVERDPDTVFLTDAGERVEVFEECGRVTVSGEEQLISPEGAKAHAATNGWEKVE